MSLSAAAGADIPGLELFHRQRSVGAFVLPFILAFFLAAHLAPADRLPQLS